MSENLVFHSPSLAESYLFHIHFLIIILNCFTLTLKYLLLLPDLLTDLLTKHWE